ncbi:MAG: hypothetical protein ACI9W2_000936 [Gammaproteobacteria bacterium]|jgi:hypothetical protein
MLANRHEDFIKISAVALKRALSSKTTSILGPEL